MAGFHGDKKLERLVLSIIDAGATAFVETGTGTGDSADAVARNRGVPVFTCEIDPQRAEEARVFMPESVHLFEMDSRQFIPLVADDAGDLPLFYLDAHWYDDWPLLGELEAIGRHYAEAIIAIHDFKVPGREKDFHFDVGGGGGPDMRATVGGADNNLDYIMPVLEGTGHEYRFLFPDYEVAERTPGFVVIFQNVEPMGELKEYRECQRCKNEGP